MKRPADRLSVLGIAVIFLLCIVAATPVSAFAFRPDRSSSKTVALGLFGNAFKDAFSNDGSLGKREDAGLKRGPNYSEVTINGKVVKKAVAGQKVSQVAAAAGQKITYSCKKGDCGTCEIAMNGRIVKACQAKIPTGKCTITTF